MERYSKKELDEEEDLGEWCNEVCLFLSPHLLNPSEALVLLLSHTEPQKWQEKEERLAQFYNETGYFVDPATTPPQRLHKENHYAELFVSFAWWTFWFASNVVPMVMCPWVRWYFLATNVGFAVLSYFVDIYSLEVKAINAQFRKDKKE